MMPVSVAVGLMFLVLLVGVALGMLWNKTENEAEIRLRKRWQKTANELLERYASVPR